MLKRILTLVGAVILSLVALFGLTWLMSSPPPVARAHVTGMGSPGIASSARQHPCYQAATDCVTITNDIFADQTWSASCYRIMTNTVTVHPGIVLTISPPVTGTRIEFQTGAQLQVLGRLQALGAPGRLITFTAANPAAPSPCNGRGRWVGIILEDDHGGDVIQHSVIEYACTGIKINDEDTVQLLSNTFRFNGGSGSRDGAIGGDTDDSDILLNHIYSCSTGIILGESFWNEVVSNTIHDIDDHALMLVSDVGPGGSQNLISDNEIHHCGSDAVRLEEGFHNQVLRNTIYLNAGSAIHLADQDRSSVGYNHVYSNGGANGYRAALYITGTGDLAEVTANVIYDEHADAIEHTVTSSFSPSMTLNALCSIPAYELENGGSPAVNAPHNWWGTNEPVAGAHYTGPVALVPWMTLALTGTTDGTVVVTLRDPAGHTVPPPPSRLTSPPAPNARQVTLSSSWGTLSPSIVFVGDAGVATAALLPLSPPAPGQIVLTATGFCGYTVTDTLELANLAITKTTALTQVAAGGVLTYLISYANTGGSAATDVRITDTLPAGTAWAGDTAVANGWTRLATAPPTWFTPTLPAGAHGSFVLSVTVPPAACGLTLTNRVTIGTPVLETRLDDNTAQSPLVTVVCADTGIAKFAAGPQGPPGAPIHFTIIYTNGSDFPAPDTVITDWLPPNTRYVSDTSGLVCGPCVAGTTGPLTWTIPTLPPRSTHGFTLTLSYSSTACPATLTNTVAISSALPDPAPGDNWYTATYRVLCDVNLVVVKDDDVGPLSPTAGGNAGHVAHWLRTAASDPLSFRAQRGITAPYGEELWGVLAPAQHRDFVYEGDLVTYTIAVVNVGTYTATHVVLTETIPEYTDYVGIGWTQVASRTFTQAVGTLAPGEGRIYYMVVHVHDSLPVGVSNLVNQVCGWSDETDVYPEDNCNYEDTPVRRWALWVAKSAEPCISPGDEFQYEITYQNRTTDTIFHNVELTDTLPTYVSYTGGAGWSCAGQVCRRTVISIPPGTSSTLLLPVRLSASFPYTLQTSITNVVEIEGGNRFVLVTLIDTGPDLAVVKNDNVGPLPLSIQARWEALAQRLVAPRLPLPSAACSTAAPLQIEQHREFVRPGERITYTIMYLNDGFGPATGVVLTETLPLYTRYVGGGWTVAGGRQYVLPVGNLAPGQGGQVQFIVQVDDPFPPGVDRVVNRVDIGGGAPECDASDNWSADDTPVQTDLKLYVANRHSGTIDVFNTTRFDHLTTIPMGGNPYGMVAYGGLLFVADFAEEAAHGRLYVVDMFSNTVVAATEVGAHPVHVAAYDGYVYVAGHSGPPPITVVRATPPWDIAALVYLNRYLTYEFGFFGATADGRRGRVYMTKPDFGGVGVWQVTPISTTPAAWQLDYVYPTDPAQGESPRSILYNPHTDRVYAAIGLIDELWIFDPEGWQLLERIHTGHQDPAYPGYGGHGLAALGQCVFVSNYRDRSVTAVVDGSCVEPLVPGMAPPPAGPYKVYLPLVGRNFASARAIVTIPVNGRPEGMTAMGNILFVALSSTNRVAMINTETLTVVGEISIPGDYPHTIILAGGNYLGPAP